MMSPAACLRSRLLPCLASAAGVCSAPFMPCFRAHISLGWMMEESAYRFVLVPSDSRSFRCLCTDPTWASANLGVYLCLNCSGVHRSLGTHITQVRSITMDAWFPDQIEVGPYRDTRMRDTPRNLPSHHAGTIPHSIPPDATHRSSALRRSALAPLQTMKTVGNARARAIWEGNLPAGFQVPDENASRAVMDVWIADKYKNKKYFKAVRPTDVQPIPIPRQFSQKVRRE
jgi:hypothetical protein